LDSPNLQNLLIHPNGPYSLQGLQPLLVSPNPVYLINMPISAGIKFDVKLDKTQAEIDNILSSIIGGPREMFSKERDIAKKVAPLGLIFTNTSDETLVYDTSDFKYGKWMTTPIKTTLNPGESTYMEMANKDCLKACSGLKGHFRFKSA